VKRPSVPHALSGNGKQQKTGSPRPDKEQGR
jgi:hypothetical protein